MGLNKQKGNMYGFVTHTWNAVKGKCPHNCEYCYMKRFPQKELRLDEKEFKINFGLDKYKIIFVGSSTDMFANDIPTEWILQILTTTEKVTKLSENRIKFLFQSKNPARMLHFDFPEYTTLATTIETNRAGFNYNAPTIQERAKAMKKLKERFENIMVTIEPIIDFDVKEFAELLLDINPDIITIGANTRPAVKLPEPPAYKIKHLITILESRGIRIIRKNNLERLLKQIQGDLR